MPLTESANQKSTVTSTATLTAVARQRGSVSSKRLPMANESKVCWIEVKHYPYQPSHQVELLHLQAEADALIMQLQNASHTNPS